MIWLDRLGIFSGIARLSIGHSLFNIAVVALIVRARAEGIGETLEQAAADLGAPPWRAFVDITLPVMFPAVLAGLLLAFTLSLDDVIISLFVQRPGSSTLPIYILSSLKAGLKGDVAALAVIMLGVSIIGIALAAWILNRGERTGRPIAS
jgi:putrescine transport system permease protein